MNRLLRKEIAAYKIMSFVVIPALLLSTLVFANPEVSEQALDMSENTFQISIDSTIVSQWFFIGKKDDLYNASYRRTNRRVVSEGEVFGFRSGKALAGKLHPP